MPSACFFGGKIWLLALTVLACGCAAQPNLPEQDDQKEEYGTSIFGRVEPPLPAIGVIAVRDGISSGVTLTNDRGGYRLVDLIAGEYSLIVSGSGFFTDLSAKNVVVKEGEEVEAPLIRLRPLGAAAALRGQVVDAVTGQPVSGVEVIVKCNSGICANLTAATDDLGWFEVKIWPDLAAELTYRKAGYRNATARVGGQPPNTVFTVPAAAMEANEP